MLDEKRIKEIEGRIRNFLSDGTIQKTKKEEPISIVGNVRYELSKEYFELRVGV